MQESEWLMEALPDEARREVLDAGDLARAWRQCPRASWLIQLTLTAGLGRAAVVRATSTLVRDALAARRSPVTDLRVHRAVTTALGWVAGRASAKDAWAAGFAATEAADAMSSADDARAARAAACLAFACDEEADDVFYAHRAYAAKAAEHASALLGENEIAADRVRAEIPLAAFLEAVDVRTRQRSEAPPPSPVEPSDSFYC